MQTKSLVMAYKNIFYKPDIERLTGSVRSLIVAKFRDPEAEFHALIQPFSDQRFTEMLTASCPYLRAILPGVSVTCQAVETHTIQVTFTFPSFTAVLVFLDYIASHEPYGVESIYKFLSSDSPLTRERLTESLRRALEEKFHHQFPPEKDLQQVYALVQQAPSTK
jgi:hypothetical protein